MAKISKLTDNGTELYPVTKRSAVYDDLGENLDTTIANLNINIDNIKNNHGQIDIILPASSWSNNTCTVAANGVYDTSTLIVAPSETSEDVYVESEVRCSSQSLNTLTFSCKTAPTVDLTAHVVVFGSTNSIELEDNDANYMINLINTLSNENQELKNRVAALENSAIDEVVPVEFGGTGATSADAARANLGAAPSYTYGTTNLTPGSSPLETGKLYFVYE